MTLAYHAIYPVGRKVWPTETLNPKVTEGSVVNSHTQKWQPMVLNSDIEKNHAMAMDLKREH